MDRYGLNFKRVLVLVIFGYCLVATAVAPAHETALPRTTSSRGVELPLVASAVFDGAHGELFSAFQEGPLQYSEFADLLRRGGYLVAESRNPLLAGILADVDLLIIAGASREIAREEIATIKSFVHGGGSLLVLLHIAPPVARLTQAFGIIVSNVVIGETEHVIGGQAQDFYVVNLEPHPITDGVGRIAVYGTWALLAEGNARLVASTSGKAWADMNRNRSFDGGEPVQPFGIVAVAEHGAGKVVVVADDAPFANRFLGYGDNRRFAEKVSDWLRR